MLLASCLAPFYELIDRWDSPLIGNDTVLTVFGALIVTGLFFLGANLVLRLEPHLLGYCLVQSAAEKAALSLTNLYLSLSTASLLPLRI